MQVNKIDPDVKDFIQAVGITESQMQDKATADFIYGFIEENGGIEAVKEWVAQID